MRWKMFKELGMILGEAQIENAKLKAEIEELKNKIKELLHDCNSCNFHKYKQTLIEIKPILECYANSKIGEEQPDGTYKLSGGIWDSFGICTTIYDPRPAREGLKKISEVEDAYI